jgi:hypothetical protein
VYRKPVWPDVNQEPLKELLTDVVQEHFTSVQIWPCPELSTIDALVVETIECKPAANNSVTLSMGGALLVQYSAGQK